MFVIFLWLLCLLRPRRMLCLLFMLCLLCLLLMLLMLLMLCLLHMLSMLCLLSMPCLLFMLFMPVSAVPSALRVAGDDRQAGAAAGPAGRTAAAAPHPTNTHAGGAEQVRQQTIQYRICDR